MSGYLEAKAADPFSPKLRGAARIIWEQPYVTQGLLPVSFRECLASMNVPAKIFTFEAATTQSHAMNMPPYNLYRAATHF